MNVVFDTSCVYAVLSPKLEPSLSKQIPPAGKRCKYNTGLYYRMEFMRRWVITGIQVYFYALTVENITEAMQIFSHNFSIRENKIVLQWAARFINSIIANPLTEPVDRFGWVVYELATYYDEVFHRFMPSKSGCKRGQIHFDEDSPTLRDALRDFLDRFNAEDHSCQLAELLDLGKNCPKLRPVLKADFKTLPRESQRPFKKLQAELLKFINTNTVPTCKTCHKIGDIIIVLEKLPATVLYHTDYSFSALCLLLKHKHKQLQSVLATAPKTKQR